MVTKQPGKIAATICAVIVMILTTGEAFAEVVARVDRERIEQNESLTLEVVIDSTVDITPDLSVLEADWVIDQTSRISDTRIVNGEISRSMRWTIVLMPKEAGVITIPPITVGNESSNPVVVTVTEPQREPPGEADVFITAEVDYARTFVQAQVLYTIRIYRAVATRQQALREPAISGVDVLIEQASDERSYEAIMNGRAYNVIERSFALFPQESGTIEISPARFEARLLSGGRITGRKVFASDPVSIEVQPIPAPPDDFPDAVWLPARDVTIADSWSRAPDELRAGEPISRNITVSALGQLETQIPVIEPPDVDGVNVYPDRPVLDRRLETDGIRGIRTDQYAMIGIDAGVVTLPELELPWWNVETGEWEVARAPERTVTILPGEDAAPPPPPAVEIQPEIEDVTEAPPPPPASSGLWRRIAEGLGVLWLLTLVTWYWTSRTRRPAEREADEAPVPVYREQSRFLKEARKAAVAEDARGVRSALLAWGRLEWPDRPPRSIGELANRVSAPLSDELSRLSAVSYGHTDAGWDGRATARAIKSFAVVDADADEDRADALPPLMPGAG